MLNQCTLVVGVIMWSLTKSFDDNDSRVANVDHRADSCGASAAFRLWQTSSELQTHSLKDGRWDPSPESVPAGTDVRPIVGWTSPSQTAL
jgi:hypothetical protein